MQGRRKDNPDHPRRGAKNRNRPRAVALAPAALQDAARLALSGFPNDPQGYDAVLKRVHKSSEAFLREFGDLVDQEQQQGKSNAAAASHRHEAARAARCAFHHAYAHNPFACAGCWLLPGRCICALASTEKAPLPQAVARVVVHAHHSEWRRASSTGVLAPLVLEGAGGDSPEASVLSLMAGHTPHDELMASMVADPRWLPVLLFPRRPPTGSSGANGDGEPAATTTAAAPSASLDEIVALALELQRKKQQEEQNPTLPLLLIVPDGTWQQARRLSLSYAAPGGKYYDPRLQFLELPSEAVAAVAARGREEEEEREEGEEEEEQAPATTPPPPSSQQPQNHQRTVSLLAPARLYRGAAKCPQRVSTAEALAAALEGLEMARVRAAGGKEGDNSAAEAAVRAIVRAVQLKVAAVRRQSGKEKLPVP
jgi:DTW domain-containing protein YfiP